MEKMTSIEDWRLNQLKKTWILILPLTFHDKLLLPYRKQQQQWSLSLFKNGVFIHEPSTEREVFNAFLKKLGWKPNKILFMDDSSINWSQVESVANALSIEFIGFIYIASKTNPVKFDEN